MYLRCRVRCFEAKLMHDPTGLLPIGSTTTVEHQGFPHANQCTCALLVDSPILPSRLPITRLCCSVCSRARGVLPVPEAEEVPLLCGKLSDIWKLFTRTCIAGQNHHLDVMYILFLLGYDHVLLVYKVGHHACSRYRVHSEEAHRWQLLIIGIRSRMWLDAHTWVGTVRIYSDAAYGPRSGLAWSLLRAGVLWDAITNYWRQANF